MRRRLSMLEISGRIIRGYGWATGYLAKQIPLIARQFPEIKNCHRGSINVRLKNPLRITRPDFATSEIDWGVMKEVFHFTRIQFEIPAKGSGKKPRRFKAWIYGPQNSPHRGDPFHVEVIARKIPLGKNRACRIRIDRAYRTAALTIVD
jgi:hypothetical protein